MSVPETPVAVPQPSTLVATDGSTYPLKSADLIARAEGGFAMTTLAQTFHNPHPEALEVVYTLPLPADGAVLGYTITVGERVIRGTIETREKARKSYEDALLSGRVAGLLEEERVATFQQNLGNIPPRTDVQVTIDVLHPLAFLPAGPRLGHAASWEYRFPTVVGVRYSGEEGRVPDLFEVSADRSGNGTPVRMQLALTVGHGEPVTGLASSSHTIVTNEAGVVSFADGSALDRDVVVSWDATTQNVGVTVIEGAGITGDDGRYALVTVVPPSQPPVVFARELTVLLDKSGSMQVERLELAKRVVGDLIRSLEPQDTFEVFAFSNHVDRVTAGQGRLPATQQNVAAALKALARVHADGGTELGDALARAFADASDETQRQVVLLTDGDVNFESEIVGRVATQSNARLHVVAIGAAPNRALTQQAAAAGRGLELLVSDEASAARAADRLVKNTASPVLVHLEVTGTAIVAQPQTGLRDVFAGQPLVVAVEVSKQGGTIEVRGLLPGSCNPWVHSAELTHASAESRRTLTTLPIGALFGRACVAELEIQQAASGYSGGEVLGRGQWDKRIERVALRHRIVSRRTSLVAIAEEASSEPGKAPRKQRLEVELPHDFSAANASQVMAAIRIPTVAPICYREMSPRFAVSAAFELDAMPLEWDSLQPQKRASRRRILGKASPTSHLHTSVVVDATLTPVEKGDWVIEFAMPSADLPKPDKSHRVIGRYLDANGDVHEVKFALVVKACTDPESTLVGDVVRLVLRLKQGVLPTGAVVTFEWRLHKFGGVLQTSPLTVPQVDSERGR